MLEEASHEELFPRSRMVSIQHRASIDEYLVTYQRGDERFTYRLGELPGRERLWVLRCQSHLSSEELKYVNLLRAKLFPPDAPPHGGREGQSKTVAGEDQVTGAQPARSTGAASQTDGRDD